MSFSSFPLSLKTDFQNWYFSLFETLRRVSEIRHATIVLIASHVACLISFFSKFHQFDGHNFIWEHKKGNIRGKN